MNDHLLSLFGRFGIGHLLRRLSLEKHDGVSASTLIIALCLFRINGASIFSCYRQHFHGLLEVGKNCFYRIMQRGGWGGYQGRDFNGQIADCTLCFITYTVLALGKRFSDYETMGELLNQREELLTLTLWHRVLSCIKRILDCLAEILDITPEQLLQSLMHNEKTTKMLHVILQELEKENNEHDRLVG